MEDAPHRALEAMRHYLADLEPARLTTEQASAELQVCAELERLAAAARTLLVRRAAEGEAWARAGHRSPASWLADVSGSGLGEAIRTLETAERLEVLPDTEDALRKGRLSFPQATEITSAAAKNPAAEKELLEAAGSESLKGLKDRARRAKARARNEDEAKDRDERVRRTRYARWWSDDDGAFRLDARLSAVDGASVLSALEAEATAVFDEAREQGAEEPVAAYTADALVRLLTRPGGDPGAPRPRHLVHLRVDLDALRHHGPCRHATGHDATSCRSSGQSGEGPREPQAGLCEIPGVGPVSFATAGHLMGDAVLKAFVTDGIDVQSVVHLGRCVPAHVESALEERDPSCVVPGCSVARGLEIDHWQVPFAQGGPSELWNLARLCHHHHHLKTYGAFELVGGPGKWGFRRRAGPRTDPGDDEPEPLPRGFDDGFEDNLLLDGL